MDAELTNQERELLLQSLDFTLRAFENYQGYPDYEFKCRRIAEVKRLIAKIKQPNEKQVSGI
jgi:hypothetical protein